MNQEIKLEIGAWNNWFWGMPVTTTEHRGAIADLEDEMSLITILYYTKY